MHHSQPCPRCGFQHNCICESEPQLDCPLPIVLLTHPREMGKDTNTGELMLRTLPNCERQIWDRTNPPSELLAMLVDPRYQPWLLFPADEHTASCAYVPDAEKIPLVIILDATWQEARKMVRRSPWLAALPRLAISADSPSSYQLRRNQTPGNLCTCEAGAAVLQELGYGTDGDALLKYFEAFITVFHADKSGHRKS
ncbi:hypothetical protein ABT56_04705 [Photobacterium aquae]|uniref:tRNA-uridine aminocarboxypropyltransferase n=1 Tax=Photobacterium aquae TaxID=1195763 RepID=A0A0J1H6N8_9GAMM|nr:DTW domain-containing protein [Photobacterium aquae]KLV07370.1 hypothetical protein ABT56_04705 [Photobacterium aquae]